MMTGRNILNSISVLLAVIAWAAAPFPLAAAGEQVPQAPIAILLSDDESAYSAPIAGFSAEVGRPVEVYNLRGDVERAPEVRTRILSRKPDLIFALGAKAAVVGRIWTRDRPEIPVIFAMVLNWRRYDLHGQDNIAGIAYDVAPGTHLANLSMISPESNHVGVIYSREHTGNIVEAAEKSAEIFNLKIVARAISSPKEFQRAFKSMEGEIDSFWILSDPVTYTLENISWLEKRCITDRIICLGPSENVAKLGVVLSVDPDRKNIGVQAASMARSILQYGQQPEKIGIMPPIGTRLFINLKTADRIGLQISRQALDQATDIIDQ